MNSSIDGIGSEGSSLEDEAAAIDDPANIVRV